MQIGHVHQATLTGGVIDAYREFIGALDSDAPERRMDRAISSIAPIDRFYVSERAKPAGRPNLIAHKTESMLAGRIGDYMDRYFRRDPVAQAIEAATEGGPIVVLRVGPEDIDEAEYRRPFFEEAAIVERVSFVHRVADRWLIMNVARRTPLGAFSDVELSDLANLSLLLLPLAARQASKLRSAARPDPVSTQVLEDRFQDKFPALTPRERQVCARTALGMTSEATALDLGIGIGSVQTYRKRAFQRLQISTAFQLAHLIMH